MKADGLEEISMTSNGIVLGRNLPSLKKAGLNKLNISLDTLEEKKFEFIARRKGHQKVLEAIDSALDLGFNSVKVSLQKRTRKLRTDFSLVINSSLSIIQVNCVVMKNLNDEEIPGFVELTREKASLIDCKCNLIMHLII